MSYVTPLNGRQTEVSGWVWNFSHDVNVFDVKDTGTIINHLNTEGLLCLHQPVPLITPPP